MASALGDLTGLMTLRDQVVIDGSVDAFFTTHYGKPAVHLVGFKKAYNANDYPFVCYVPNEAVRGKLGGDVEVISIVLGVYDPVVSAGVSQGIASLARASALVFDAINAAWATSGTVFLGTVKEANDFGVAHPIYHKEMQVPLKVRR